VNTNIRRKRSTLTSDRTDVTALGLAEWPMNVSMEDKFAFMKTDDIAIQNAL